MSRFQTMRSLMKQRLAAAVDVMAKQFQKTLTEYEEEICRVKEEQKRQQELLDAVSNPEVQLHTADVQQLMVQSEKVPSEQEDCRPSLDEENPAEPAHLKEEQEEEWINQEREEDDIIKFIFTPVPEKSEEDEEKPQSLQHHENQREEHLETEADVEDCDGSEPDGDFHPDSYLQPVSPDETSELSGSDTKCGNRRTSAHSSKCASSSRRKKQQKHKGIKNPAEPLTCSVCGKMFDTKMKLFHHAVRHQRKNHFSCPVCGQSYRTKKILQSHMKIIHSDKKPLSCSVCEKSFLSKPQLQSHMRTHTGERPFACSLCDKKYPHPKSLRDHMVTHGEKKFRCTICDNRFFYNSSLKSHLRVHRVKKTFSCLICNKYFTQQHNFEAHKCFNPSRKKSKKPEDCQKMLH